MFKRFENLRFKCLNILKMYLEKNTIAKISLVVNQHEIMIKSCIIVRNMGREEIS